MTETPPALTPAECDLRDYPWMPLDVLRLRDSTIAAVESAEAFRCAVLLWCASWHQIPAASLPDDEAQLARLAGYGRDVKAFRNARKGDAMRGWVLCSDGRLYHPVVAEKANESWSKKLAQRARTEAARAAKAAKNKTTPDAPPTQQTSPVTTSVTENVTDIATRRVTASVTDIVTGSTGEEKTGQEIQEEPPSLRSGTPSAARGCRLPADWQPDAECVQFAMAEGLNPQAVAAKFRDYWHAKAGKDACKINWIATWRNWCRDDAKRQPSAQQPTRAQQQNARVRALLDDHEPPMLELGRPH